MAPSVPTVSLAASPQAIQQASAASLTWNSTNASACTASGGWSGTKPPSGTESTGALSSSTVFSLACAGAGGSAAQTVTVDVVQPPAPAPAPTVTLTVNPPSVVSGNAATLSWRSTDATACSAAGNWSGTKPTSGTASTGALTANSAFALTCTGEGGAATQSVEVAVTQPSAPSVVLSASPSTVATGGSSTLTWSSTNATACNASGGWSGAKTPTGSQILTNLQATATYALTCTGPGGSAGQSTIVTVATAAAPTVTLSASPTTVASGGSSTLTWATTNATSCTASGAWSGSRSTSGTQSSGPLTVTSNYILTCTGPGGSAAQSVQVQVTAPPQPTVSLTAAPASIARGSTTSLAWSATDATSCTASGGWSGARPVSGSETSVTLTQTTDFALSCTGPGGTAARTVTVNVIQPAPTLTLTAAPTTLTQGGAALLTWTSSNATSCTASGDWSGDKDLSGSASTGALSTVRTYSYTLVCAGTGGTISRTATVAVAAAPPVPTVSISANPAQIASGGTSILSWSSSNATACTASGGWTGARSTSGTLAVGPLTQSTTYTLTCTGPGGQGAGSTTVAVSPATPVPTLALSANPTAVAQGGSSTLTWTTTNATACEASGDWTGTKGISGSASTGSLGTVKTYSYALTCTGPGGSASQTATVTVSAVTPAPTVSLSANPTQVGVNGTSTLSWSSTNASACTASGGWSGSKATSGSQATAALTQTTSFVLTCTGPGGSGSNSVTVTVTGSTPVTLFPLRVGADARHLVDQNNLPFLVVGDTPWSLMTAITKADAAAYLDDRRARGFNAIIVNIIEHQFNGPRNQEGNLPFQITGGYYDFSKPVEAYFANVDYVLGLARDKGMLVLLTPAYLGYGGGSEGWWPDINSSVNTEAVMEGYGRFLGSRYRGFNNILWVMGGDWYGAESLPKTRALVRGLQATDQAGRLFTAHNARQQSGADTYNGEAWFTVNTTYSECLQTPPHLITDYQRTPTRPFVYFEGRYENEQDWSMQCLRSQAYWPVLLGGFGSFFGNRPIWLFDPGWQSALNSAGAQSMTLYGKLFRSRAWHKLVPDLSGTVLTSGQMSGASYAAAARASDGSSVIVYTPTQRALTVDMTKVGGSNARGWWFNPATGATTDLGTMATTGTRSFLPPGTGDWVLVLDDASLGLAAPGQ